MLIKFLHITLRVSTNMAIIRRSELLFDGNCCTFVFIVTTSVTCRLAAEFVNEIYPRSTQHQCVWGLCPLSVIPLKRGNLRYWTQQSRRLSSPEDLNRFRFRNFFQLVRIPDDEQSSYPLRSQTPPSEPFKFYPVSQHEAHSYKAAFNV
jgi:hypothetical protein